MFETPDRQGPAYRPDIDGLRAIAVLSIVLFHVDATWLPGGFVGVDIFFVISGYLITGNLLKAMQPGTFSFTDFYRRRIKRIMPAMLFVTLISLVAGQFILLPDDLNKLAESAIASALSAANVYFTYFLDTSYFAPETAHQPLLHLWSLGVEEQFYLIWPAALLALYKMKRRALLLLSITTVAALSFLLAELLLSTAPMFAYYMLPTRAGQLLLGASCSVLASQYSLRGNAMQLLLQATGCALAAVSLFSLNEEIRYPGLNALPITIGTALLLLGGAGYTTSIGKLLSWKPVSSIGLISYSMYLWHWPLLAYSRYALGELSLTYKLALITVLVCLSGVTYAFIETPYRRSQQGFRRLILRQFVVPAAFVCTFSVLILQTDGLGLYAIGSDYKSALNDLPQRAGDETYVCQRTRVTAGYLRQPECIIGAEYSGPDNQPSARNEPNILLWGDSNAAHYVGFIGELADEYGFAFRNIAHGMCLPILDRPEQFAPSRRALDCEASGIAVRSQLEHYQTVIISGAWMRPIERFPNFLPSLETTVRSLMNEGKRVIILGRVPFIPAVDGLCAAKAIKLAFLNCKDRSNVPRKEVESYNSLLRDLAKNTGASYYDVSRFICSNDACSSYLQDKQLYRDPGHIGHQGSIILGSLARKDEEARRVFGVLMGDLGGGKRIPPPWRATDHSETKNSWLMPE